jgi:hypothetical protein
MLRVTSRRGDSSDMRIARFMVGLLVCTFAVWAQSAAGHQRPAAAAQKRAGNPKLTDAQLEAKIRAKFAGSKSAGKFTVRVQGGVANIDGKTDVAQHKGAATRMAKTAGAVAVNNKVQVSDEGKKKAAGNLQEGRRRAQVKRGDVRDSRK